MTWQRHSELVRALQASDLGWWISTDTQARLAAVLSEAAAVTDELKQAFPVHYGALGPEWVLADWMIDEQARLKPFIQTFEQPMTTTMRTMVLAVVLGASVALLHMEYRRKAVATLSVQIELPSGESHTFESDDLWDFEVLRHFGLMKVGGHPVLDGYYAFRKDAP